MSSLINFCEQINREKPFSFISSHKLNLPTGCINLALFCPPLPTSKNSSKLIYVNDFSIVKEGNDRVLQEAKILYILSQASSQQLNNNVSSLVPFIPQFINFQVINSNHYLLEMSRMPGESLYDKLKKITWNTLKIILRNILAQYQYLYHNFQFTHYDFHPSNVHVDENLSTYMIDFEYSRLIFEGEIYGTNFPAIGASAQFQFWANDWFKMLGALTYNSHEIYTYYKEHIRIVANEFNCLLIADCCYSEYEHSYLLINQLYLNLQHQDHLEILEKKYFSTGLSANRWDLIEKKYSEFIGHNAGYYTYKEIYLQLVNMMKFFNKEIDFNWLKRYREYLINFQLFLTNGLIEVKLEDFIKYLNDRKIL